MKDIEILLREKQEFLVMAAKARLLNFCQLINNNFEAVWFHELIAQALEKALLRAAKKEKSRIILTIPPRHGKTLLASTYFPAWALGKYPELKFILSTYGAELSEKIGLSTRDVINSEMYQHIFPGINLRPDVKAKAKWMTNKGGSFTAVGIGGAVTGIGGDCVVPYSTVYTSRGILPISKIKTGDKIYAYDHKQQRTVLTIVRAVSARLTKKRIVSVEGLKCTEDHRIFIKGRGYINAAETKGLPTLRWDEGGSRTSLYSVLSKIKDTKKGTYLSKLLGKVLAISVRNRQSARPKWFIKDVLQSEVLHGMEEKKSCDKNIPRGLRDVQEVSVWKEKNKILFVQMLFLKEKFIPYFRGVFRNIFSAANNYCREGRESMSTLREKKISNAGTPYQSQQRNEYDRESNVDLPEVPCVVSQSTALCADDIAKDLYGEGEYVVDIQTDTQNFFCEGILIHNCIIIDDPHKSREEAESETTRNTVWEYYRSTLYSRLEGYGAVIVIMQRWHCLSKDQHVNIGGQMVKTQEIKVGDLILTPKGYQPIKAIQKNKIGDKKMLRMYFTGSGETLEVTDDHLIKTKKGWVKAGEMKVGDYAVLECKEAEDITTEKELQSIEIVDYDDYVYDVTVDAGEINVGGVTIHNCDDLIGRLMEEEAKKIAAGEESEGWEVINFPAIAEEDEYQEDKLLRKEGEALWPSKFPVPVLNNIKSVSGIYNFLSQYMQNPIHSETQEFKEHFFKYFEEEDLKTRNLRYYTLIDPAISQKKEADNTVVLTIAKDQNGPNWYRIREDAGKYTPQQTVDLIFLHHNLYNGDVFLETVAYQLALKYSIIDEQKKKQVYFNVNEVKTTSNKEVRIRGLLPLYAAGVIYHRKSDLEYEREALSFPRGKRDDRIDCMSIGLMAINNQGGRMATQFKKKFNGYFKSRG